MKYFTFKNNDKIPLLGLGTWQAKTGEVYNAVREAIRTGYRHIDCASMYGNEAEIGQALKDAITDGEVSRNELWITSKLWCDCHGKENVIPALWKTLYDLQLDYLDLYLIHWPIPMKKSVKFPTLPEHFYSWNEVPVSNTWEGMEESVKQGLTRHIGVSNFSIKKIKNLIKVSKIRPEVNQIELHPYLQQKEMLEFCKNEQIHLTAYAPLSAKSPNTARPQNVPDLLTDVFIAEIAQRLNVTIAQTVLAWGVSRGTSVIPKSVNPERLKQNLQAADIEIPFVFMEIISRLDQHYRYIDGTGWAVPGSGYDLSNIWDE